MTLQDGIFQCNLSVRSKVYSYKLLFGLSLPCFAPHSEPGAGNMCLPQLVYTACVHLSVMFCPHKCLFVHVGVLELY